MDARKRRECRQQALEKRSRLGFVVIRRPRQVHAHRGDAIDLETRLNLLKLRETANEQSRADEERDRECDFADDEHAAEPLSGAATASATRTLLEAFTNLRPRRLHGRNQAEEEPRQEPSRESKAEDPDIHGDLVETRESRRWSRRRKKPRAQPCDEQSERPCEKCHKHRFDQ